MLIYPVAYKPQHTAESTQLPQSEIINYHVDRTPSKQLPIYHLIKAGGNLKQTRIRKISGDITALRTDLQRELGLREDQIRINQLTRHIIIKVRCEIRL